MTRKNARELAVRLCYALSENPVPADDFITDFFESEHYASLGGEDELFTREGAEEHMDYLRRVVCGVAEHSAELDGYVEKYAKGWKFARISRTALAVMKVAMFEVLYMPEIPNGAAINEAVELAKKYDEPDTVRFVNGVLGSFAREESI